MNPQRSSVPPLAVGVVPARRLDADAYLMELHPVGKGMYIILMYSAGRGASEQGTCCYEGRTAPQPWERVRLTWMEATGGEPLEVADG